MESIDPNKDICPDATDVLTWQAAAALEPTPERSAAIQRADKLLLSCQRCVDGSLLRGDPTKTCALASCAIRFTSLGPKY